MKASELRIGNWVLLNEEFLKVESVASNRAYEYNGAYTAIELSDKDSHTLYIGESCEGIPLTEEILLKAGFIKSDMDGYYYYNSLLVMYKRFEFFGLVGASLSFREIKYVHELQNRIYDLLGQELNIEL